MHAQRFLIPSLLIVALCGLAAAPAAGADPVPTNYILERVVTGHDFYGQNGPYAMDADSNGGYLRARIRYRRDCQEQYEFTWKFNRDMRVLRPGDEFVVTASASVKGGSCYPDGPHMMVFGSNHHSQPKPLRELKFPVGKIGNHDIDGSTDRVRTKPGGSKVARFKFTRAGPDRIWFAVGAYGGAPGPKGVLAYSLVYLYKAQYGPVREPAPDAGSPGSDDPSVPDRDPGNPVGTGTGNGTRGAAEPWRDPRLQRCIDAWLAKAVAILNRRARDRGPWGVSPYGHLLNKQARSYSAPDGWAGKYHSSKHTFVWIEWSRAHTNPAYGGELPALHSHCGGVSGGGGAPGGPGSTSPGTSPGTTPGAGSGGIPRTWPRPGAGNGGTPPARTNSGLEITGARVRFFEAADDGKGLGTRTIATRFRTSLTRYVYWELQIDVRPLSVRKNFSVEAVWFQADGSVFNRTTKATYVDRGWTNTVTHAGFGANKTGSWKMGPYRVEFRVDGKKIAEGAFFIVR